MAERTTTTYEPESETWASGIAQFGAAMMILSGAFQAATGAVALLRGDFFAATRNYVFQLNTTTWGWVHIVVGAVVVVAGCGVLAKQTWGVVLGVIACAVGALTNFAFLPYYPIWSIVIIGLNVLVIWALLTYRRGATRP